MKQRMLPNLTGPVLLLLLTLCAGCSPAPLVVPAQRQPLPPEARQPPPPEICQPTCSAGLARLLDSLLRSPTPGAAQLGPASGSPGSR